MPILAHEPPALEAIIKMSLYKYKTGCSTMQFKCKKNSLVCTEMCLCTGCENATVDKDLEHPLVYHDNGEDNGI